MGNSVTDRRAGLPCRTVPGSGLLVAVSAAGDSVFLGPSHHLLTGTLVPETEAWGCPHGTLWGAVLQPGHQHDLAVVCPAALRASGHSWVVCV